MYVSHVCVSIAYFMIIISSSGFLLMSGTIASLVGYPIGSSNINFSLVFLPSKSLNRGPAFIGVEVTVTNPAFCKNLRCRIFTVCYVSRLYHIQVTGVMLVTTRTRKKQSNKKADEIEVVSLRGRNDFVPHPQGDILYFTWMAARRRPTEMQTLISW